MKKNNFCKAMKCMIAATLLCGMGMNAKAQSYYETKHEIGVSVGAGHNTDWLDAFEDTGGSLGEALISSIITGGTMTSLTSYENEKSLPSISVEYFYHVNKVIGIGGIAGYCGKTSDVYSIEQNNVKETSTKEQVGDTKKQFITVMPAIKFDWLRKKSFGLYSKAAAGVTFTHSEANIKNESDNENDTHFNFQATLIGAEVGSQNFRAFAELGVGQQGAALVGVKYKF